MKLSQLKPNPNNPRLIKDDKFRKLVTSLSEFPEMIEKRPMVCVTDADGKLYPLGGNMRLKALKELKYKEIPDEWVMLADEWSEEKRKEFTIKDNVGFGEWDWDTLANEWNVEELSEWGLDIPNFELDEEEKEQRKKLSDRFIIPPFSVLDTNLGRWKDRKNYWLSLGIKSEIGRSAVCISSNDVILRDGTKYSTVNTDGTSIFDPVLCELVYK